MLDKDVKRKVLEEKDLNKALEILKPYNGENWDTEIMEHLQKITPDDEIPIDSFSYIRPNK